MSVLFTKFPDKVLCIDDAQQNPHPFEFPLDFPGGEIKRGFIYHVLRTSESGLHYFLLGFPRLNTAGVDIGFSHRCFKVLR